MSYASFDLASLTELDFGTPGRVYRSPMPFSSQDPGQHLFQSCQAKGISAVVVLAEADECAWETGRDLLAFYREQGLLVIHCPIVDFQTPNWQSFDRALHTVVARAKAGENTAVHCYAGIGRTGMFMACLAHALLEKDGKESIAWVRQYIRGAVEKEAQRQFVEEYCT